MNCRNLSILSIAAVAVGAALVAMPAFAQSTNDDKAKASATSSGSKADSPESRKEQADRQAKKLEEIRKANAERRKKTGGEAEEG